MSSSILIVDDEKAQRDILQAILSREGYRAVVAGSGQEALGKLKQDEFDLILTDLKMQGMSGMELLEKVLHDNPDQCVIIMTAHGTIDSAVEATRKGAFNYLEKPLDREHLLFTLQRACEHLALLRENSALHRKLDETTSIEGIIGDHPTRLPRQGRQFLFMESRAPARNLLPGPFTIAVRAAASRFLPSTVRQSLTHLLKANFSAMKKGRSPGQTARKSGCLKLRQKGRSFSMRSAK